MTKTENEILVEQMSEMLQTSQEKLEAIESEYNRLRAQMNFYKDQVKHYQDSIKHLKAIEEGNYPQPTADEDDVTEPAVRTRKSTGILRADIRACFLEAPALLRSPKEVTEWLVTKRSWPDTKNMGSRVSNLLRKIAFDKQKNKNSQIPDDYWLAKEKHGKYRLIK